MISVPMVASKKDLAWLRCALTLAELGRCHRLQVGCVLVDARSQVLSTGYNGRAAGLPNCPTSDNKHLTATQLLDRCHNSDAPIGQPNGCESIHAEQNALLQCRDVRAIGTAYISHSPCLVCVKLLLNTSCERIVFHHEYPAHEARHLWIVAGRLWHHVQS